MQPRLPPDRILQAARADAFIEDHAQALQIVELLKTAATPPAAHEAARRAAGFLGPHIEEEEAVDGVFHWIRALEPGLSDELERLSAEHLEIHQLLAQAVAASPSQVVGLARALATRLELHEAAERAALDRAVR